jgi:hypothetical protein
MVLGYGTSREDYDNANRPAFTLNAGVTSATVLDFGGTRAGYSHLEIDCNAQTSSLGLLQDQTYTWGFSVTFDSCRAGAVSQTQSSASLVNFKVTDSGGIFGAAVRLAGAASDGEVADCSGTDAGVHLLSNASINNILAHNCQYGFESINASFKASHITAADNAADGLRVQNGDNWGGQIANSVFANNSGYGILSGAAAGPGHMCVRCLTGNNTSGHANNWTDTFRPLKLEASGDPFVNAASDDYRLDSTSGEGLLGHDAALCARYISDSTECNLDVGALDHEDPAGGSGAVIIRQGVSL